MLSAASDSSETVPRAELSLPFRLGDFYVEPTLHQLRHGDRIEKIEPRLMRVLCLLAAQPGEVISREALLEAVWSESYVQDEALTQAISKLRRALGDRARDARMIETIPKAGYRLVAPVEIDEPLDPLLRTGTDAPAGTDAPGSRGVFRRTPQVVLAALVILGIALGIWFWPSPDTDSLAPPQPITLTTFRGQERHPAIAPDGQRVAFTWDQGGEQAPGIFVKQIGSEQPVQLTRPNGEDRRPAWSPDGRFVAFVRHEEEQHSLYVVPSIGGPERLVTRRASAPRSGLAWSPDGQWIALADRPQLDAPSGIVFVAVDGSTERRLTAPPLGVVGDRRPAFSPDGSRLAFVRTTVDGAEDVYMMDLPDGTPRRLSTWERVVLGVGWSTDEESLLAASLVDGGFRLFRLPLGGGDPRPLFASSEQLLQAALDPANGQLVYVASDIEVNIWSHTEGQAEDTPSVSSTAWDSNPQLSPDGTRLAFASARELSPEIWTSDADGSTPQRLTQFAGPYVGSPSWSPDGRTLAFDVREGGQADLYLISADGGAVRRLTDTPHDEVLPSWSHDGERLYFASNHGGEWQVRAQSLTDTYSTAVTREGGYFAQESADGGTLYFTRRGEDGLWQKPLPDGAETRLLSSPNARNWGAWDVTDIGILALRDGAGSHLILADPSTGTERLWAALPVMIPEGHRVFSATPDGRRLFYSRVERLESDLKRLVWPSPF